MRKQIHILGAMVPMAITPAATAALLITTGIALPLGTAAAAPPAKKQPTKPQTKVPPLKATEFPDGTGTVSLPAGWRIDGVYRGMVVCRGPHGTAVIMGRSQNILRPDHPIANMPERAAMAPIAMADVGDLNNAVVEVLKIAKANLISLRSQPAPSAIDGVPAVNFLYEFEQNGKTIMAMGYFSSIGDPNDTVLPYWQLYSSAVFAPKERFLKDLPTLMAIYSSWRPNGQKPKEGSNSALIDAVNAANRKRADDSLKSQQEAFDRMNAKFVNEVIKS